MTSNIYFLQGKSGGPIKIGVAKNSLKRLASHQVSNWQQLVIILELKNCHHGMEKEIHQHLKEFRIRGEWFKEDILYNIGALQTELKTMSYKHRDTNERVRDWLIWPNLTYKIKLYETNATRRLYKLKSNSEVRERLAKVISFIQPSYG